MISDLVHIRYNEDGITKWVSFDQLRKSDSDQSNARHKNANVSKIIPVNIISF